jgi:hypothetical protein
MLKLFSLCIITLTIGVSTSHAASTLQFSQGGKGATNFANSSGTVTNGMSWGLIIDTSGNGFQAGSYGQFSVNASGFLEINGVATDDYYVSTGLATQTIGAPFFSGGEAGAGAITTTTGGPDVGTVAGLTAGDAFGLVWFSNVGDTSASVGDAYGFFTHGSFTYGGAGSIISFSNAFTGTDPIRSANLTVAGIPEPSRAVLVFGGVLGLAMRRRRTA